MQTAEESKSTIIPVAENPGRVDDGGCVTCLISSGNFIALKGIKGSDHFNILGDRNYAP